MHKIRLVARLPGRNRELRRLGDSQIVRAERRPEEIQMRRAVD
jgi:hypothetical protein